MPLANISLTDTFNTWRTRFNQGLVVTNALIEGTHNSTGTIVFTNPAYMAGNDTIYVQNGHIRILNNTFYSNTLSVISNHNSLLISGTGSLGSKMFMNVVNLSSGLSDTSPANIAAASAVNSLHTLVLTANAHIGNAYGQANTARDTGNTAQTDATNAYGKANTSGTDATNAYGQANTARNTGNTAQTDATNAFGKANAGFDQANTARDTANTASTNATNAFGKANTAGTDATNAFDKANNALPNTNSTLAGSLTTTGFVADSKGDVRNLPINNQTAAYVLSIADVGKVVSITTGGVTVPNAIFYAGNVTSIFNNSASSQTISNAGAVTLMLAGGSSVGNRTLAQKGFATVYCMAANNFVIAGAGVT